MLARGILAKNALRLIPATVRRSSKTLSKEILALFEVQGQNLLKTAPIRPLSVSARQLASEEEDDEDYEDESDRYWAQPWNRTLVGQDAPWFKGQAVVNKQFEEISLKDYINKWLILFFYPLDFTFVCPTEIRAFSERADEFQSRGCELVACSVDSHFSHLAWINQSPKQGGLGDMKIPVLSDQKHSIAKAYGTYNADLGVAFRGLYLIDPNGKVRHQSINDLPVGRSVDEALRLLDAFQFVEKHGEVCPANWKPKSPTIKPTVDGSKEYFEKVN